MANEFIQDNMWVERLRKLQLENTKIKAEFGCHQLNLALV